MDDALVSCASCTALLRITELTLPTAEGTMLVDGGDGGDDFFFLLFFGFDVVMGGRMPSFMRCLQKFNGIFKWSIRVG